jgi:protein TonB
VLAAAGTLAFHVIALVAADAIAVTHPLRLDPPAPHVRLIDVKMQRRAPIAPPQHRDPAKPRAVQVPTTTPRPTAPSRPRTAQQIAVLPSASHATTTDIPVTPSPTPGGGDGPVVAIDDLAPAATGVAVAKRPGSGGTGGGTGYGSGSGSGAGSGAAPASIAAIQVPAMPRGDYGYVLSKDYPPEAKQLAIEGTLKVRLVVDSDGKVTSATLLDHLGHGLDELALAQARSFEFTAARDADGHAVSSVVVWTFHMTPPK